MNRYARRSSQIEFLKQLCNLINCRRLSKRLRAQGLDKSRCFVEKRNGSLAMQLVLVPSDSELPKTKIPSQEYIVLIDRSGSMEGVRIDKAKEALVVLLRKLPKGGTTFNIVSFGNKVDMMKKTSLEYDQESLDSAVSQLLSLREVVNLLALRSDISRGVNVGKYGRYRTCEGTAMYLRFPAD